MSVLNKLKQKKKERLTQKHPLFNEDISVKYPYCIGVVMEALVDESINEKEEEMLTDLIYSMGLPENYKEKIIEAAQSEDEDLIDGVIDIIDNRDKKYMFILDLYRISYADKTISEEEKEALDIFGDMLNLEDFEKEFLERFAEAAVKNNNEMACKAYEEIMKKEMEPNFNILKYFMKKFEYIQIIEGYELSTGEVLILNKPCIVNGIIEVPSGTRLVIDGADIQLAGQIHVSGGQISIDNANIQATEGCEEVMCYFNNISKVEINNTNFDGSRIVGAISHDGGVLEVNECVFKNTNIYNAVYFDGSLCNIKNTKFDDCVAANNRGGALSLHKGDVSIENCEFNKCEASSGGAIYIYIAKAKISKTTFIDCKAIESGAAIYAGNNYGIKIIDCEYTDCSPSNTMLYNCSDLEN